MKNVICLILVVLFSYNIQAQLSLEIIPNPNVDCANCFNNYDVTTGTKFQIGFGIVKEIVPRFDAVSNIGYGYWNYNLVFKSFDGRIVDEFNRDEHVFNLSIGERFHIVQFGNSSIYSGLNLNFQIHAGDFIQNTGFSLEPTFGWRKSTGKKTEIFIAAGYDQHLNRAVENQKPGKVTVNLGFNVVLKNKEFVQAPTQ